MARPRKVVDEEALRRLARLGATDIQIGHALQVSTDVLARRYRDMIDTARAEGGIWALERLRVRAEHGYWPAIEFLLVHLCGWGKAHADQVINIVQQNAIAAPAQLTMQEFRRQTIEAQEFARKYFHEQQSLTDGNGDLRDGEVEGI